MKKILSIILALALCLSFAACGNNTATDSTDAGSISENSSASVSEESSLEAESSEETSELTSDTDSGVYEVTVDNWQDYLEFGYDVMVDYEDDGVTVEDITLYPSIFVKDGYKIAKGDEKVELAFDAKYEWRYVFINKEDFTYEIGGICEGHDPYKDTVLDTFLGYHEEFDDPDYPEVHSSWLQGTVTTTAGYTEYTGDIPVEKLFHFGEKEEDGTTLYNIPAQMVPVITCTEASGKVANR